MALPFFTVGHSTRSLADFVALLRVGEVAMVIDVRTVPRSRTNPQYDADGLGEALAEYQIGHGRIPALGGLRGRVRAVPPEVNGWWTHRSFHNYADHALSEAFRAGLDGLVAIGRERRTAVMCSEAVWWRCHRRLIADHLLAPGRDRLSPDGQAPRRTRAPVGRRVGGGRNPHLSRGDSRLMTVVSVRAAEKGPFRIGFPPVGARIAPTSA
jgi:hypothetical protein